MFCYKLVKAASESCGLAAATASPSQEVKKRQDTDEITTEWLLHWVHAMKMLPLA